MCVASWADEARSPLWLIRCLSKDKAYLNTYAIKYRFTGSSTPLGRFMKCTLTEVNTSAKSAEPLLAAAGAAKKKSTQLNVN